MATDTSLQPVAPVSSSGPKLAVKIFLWVLALIVLGVAWFALLANVAPARLNFSSGGAILMASAPPMLLMLLCWTGVQRFSAPHTKPQALQVPDAAALPSKPPMSTARFRIGAWSALTPFGNVTETAQGTKSRTKVVKPDKSILLPSGYPAHAGIIDIVNLEAMGHAPGTRLRAPRVMAMLAAILDDLHAQQATLTQSTEGPANVYWLVPQALMTGGDTQNALFDYAWKHSAWRDDAYLLHTIPDGDANVFTVLSVLQNGIDQSPVPYTILIAADSLLDREELARALALGQVFSHTAPLGFIPSEGAGGVVLFNPGSTSDDQWANAAIMGPVKAAGRDTHYDGLPGVMSAALTACGARAVDIGIVVSDSDHRSPGSVAAIGAMTQVLSELDPLEHRISPMEYAGAFGAASDLVHLALAVELAGEKPVLALSTSGGRCASVVISPNL